MLYLLLLYSFVTFLCLWSGLVLHALIHRFTGQTGNYEKPVFSYFISGLLLLTALAQWVVLFLPLDLHSLVLILALLTGLSCLLRTSIMTGARRLWISLCNLPLPSAIVFFVFFFMILTLNAGPVIMDDSESYHIQMIKWIQEYGTVPGIANLHLRFGFNSSWFSSIGLLSPPLRKVNHYMALNGLLSIGLFHYLLQKIRSTYSTAPSGTFMNLPIGVALILVMSLVVWPMLRGNAATANYDFITTCSLVVLFIESAAVSAETMLTESILWPCYLFTVRTINAPILLYALIMLIITGRSSKRRAVLFMGIALFITIPFIIRNVILSGYPFFPLYQVDLFNMDWKVNRSLLVEISEYIKYYNRSAAAPQLVRHLSTPAWLAIWYQRQVIYDKVLLDVSVACWTGLLIYWRKKVRPYPFHYRALIITMLLQLCFWMCTAPDPRFAYGPLLNGLYAFAALFPLTFSLPAGRKLVNGFLTITAGCLFIYTVRKTIINPDYRNVSMPHPLPVPTTTTIAVDGIRLHIPDKVLNNWNPRCYDLELPCLYHVNPYLQARGKEIKDGFRLAATKDTVTMQGEYKISDN